MKVPKGLEIATGGGALAIYSMALTALSRHDYAAGAVWLFLLIAPAAAVMKWHDELEFEHASYRECLKCATVIAIFVFAGSEVGQFLSTAFDTALHDIGAVGLWIGAAIVIVGVLSVLNPYFHPITDDSVSDVIPN
jgi:uncharacterized membrane protein YfcA